MHVTMAHARICQRHMHSGDHYTHTFPWLISKHNVSLHFSLEGFHCAFPNFALIPPHYLSYSTKIELSNVSCIGRALVDQSSISLQLQQLFSLYTLIIEHDHRMKFLHSSSPYCVDIQFIYEAIREQLCKVSQLIWSGETFWTNKL